MDVSGGSVVKNPPANARDAGLIPGSGRSTGEGNGNSLLYSCMEIPGKRSLESYSPWGCKRVGLSEFTVIDFGSIQDNTPSLLLNNNFPPLKNINSKLYQKINKKLVVVYLNII